MPQTDAHVPGRTVLDEVIPARAGWSRVIEKDQILRVIDLEGRQAVDFICYNANDYEDRYGAPDTLKINPGGIFIGLGTVLYSVNCNPLFTVVADTCGKHDTMGGCCSDAINRTRYNAPGHPNCRQNFLDQLAEYGMDSRDIPDNLNFFVYMPVAESGAFLLEPGLSKPGDYVDLRAEMNVLTVISNCPQINNPINDFNPTPIQVTVFEAN